MSKQLEYFLTWFENTAIFPVIKQVIFNMILNITFHTWTVIYGGVGKRKKVCVQTICSLAIFNQKRYTYLKLLWTIYSLILFILVRAWQASIGHVYTTFISIQFSKIYLISLKGDRKINSCLLSMLPLVLKI